MTDHNNEIPINEVAKLLDKSDRQIRRYVKDRRLKATPVRVDGHIKLMFDKQDVEAFGRQFTYEGQLQGAGNEIVVDAQLLGDRDAAKDDPAHVMDSIVTSDSDAVKYVVDVLREQITGLRGEVKDLHYQLEQRSGQVGFLQGQMEALQAELKMLAPVPKPEEQPTRAPWYRRLFGG